MNVFVKPKPRGRFYRRHRDALLAALLLSVPIGFWLLFNGYPLIFGLMLGFFEWKGISSGPKWAGLDNFIAFFRSADWTGALLRTIGLGMLCFAVSTVLGLLVALLLNRVRRGQGLFRMLWYLPSITAGVATSQIFNILLEYDGGVINNIILSLGREPIYWSYSTPWMVFWIVAYSTWTGLGGSTLMWLAALQSIDPSLVEASKLDGCNRLQTFFRISVPQMMPLIVFMCVNGFIGAMNIYENVLFISGGGPMGSTEVLAYKIMRAGFWDNDFGMAGTASFIVMLITVFFSAFIFRRQVKSYRETGG